MIFGTLKNLTDLSTAPARCSHFTFGNPKKSFSTVLFIHSEWWGAGMVICLERGADLHMAQLMPLPLTISCFSKIQIGFTFLVPALRLTWVVPEKGR